MNDLQLKVLNDYPFLLDIHREWSYYCYDPYNVKFTSDSSYVHYINNSVCSIMEDSELSILFREAEKINNAFYARKSRLKHRIISMYIRAPCYFCTFTFTDDVLNSTSFETRRKYIKRFLKSVSSDYVANVDFGDSTGREHYHAVCNFINPDDVSWPFGFQKLQLVRNCESDFNRLSSYISKLTNHALKNSANKYKIIYSRS